jgi:hypothetical protein
MGKCTLKSDVITMIQTENIKKTHTAIITAKYDGMPMIAAKIHRSHQNNTLEMKTIHTVTCITNSMELNPS